MLLSGDGVQRRFELIDRHRAGPDATAGGFGGQPLEHLVGRRRHSVEAAEQDDLAVEVVGLDAAEAPLEALPGRPRVSGAAADRADGEQVAPPGTVFVSIDEVDARGPQAGDALLTD